MTNFDLDTLHCTIELIHSNKLRYVSDNNRLQGFLELMVGEYDLGDINNNYLYIGWDAVRTREMRDSFVNKIKNDNNEKKLWVGENLVSIEYYGMGQSFYFINIDAIETQSNPTITGSLSKKFDKIFVDIISENHLSRLNAMPNLLQKWLTDQTEII